MPEVDAGEGSTNMSTGNTTTPEIAQVAVRIPPFWRKNVRIWFLQVESQFVNARITKDETKFHHVRGSLDPEVAEHIADYLLKPASQTDYNGLKQRILEEFEESEAKKSKRLLSEIELGDRKPTALLREMQALAGNHISEEFMRSMFLQRLPQHVRSILATCADNLEKVANMADRIMEMATPGYEVSAITTETARISRLEKHMAELALQMSELVRARSRGRSDSRGRSESRSPARHRSPRPAGMCWYHWQFQERAKRCTKPCTFGKAEN
jgi:hypothetical protein